MPNFFQPLASEPEVRAHFVKFVGGSGAVTKVFGQGVTVTYSTTGVVVLTWAQKPGTFLGAFFGFQATTAADVKGHTCVPGAWNSSARTLTLNITNASDSLHDLAALEWLNCLILFKATSV